MYTILYIGCRAVSVRNRLKEVRLQRGHTQEALATLVGVTRQTVIAVEKGKFVPSVKLALELAAVLDTPLAELFWLDSTKGSGSWKA
jgi:putative transcriptional regulator